MAQTRSRLLLPLIVGCGIVLGGCSLPLGSDNATPTPIALSVPAPMTSAGEEPTLEPYNFTDGAGAPFPVPSTEANPIVTISRESAWGDGIMIKEVSASLDAEHVLMLAAVAEDGRFIVGHVVPQAQSSGEPFRLVLLDLANQQVTELATLGSDSSPYLYYWQAVAVDGDWVVWREDKRFKTYNVMTRLFSEIPSATDQFGSLPNVPLPPSKNLSVDHGIVVWAESSGEQPPEGRVPTDVKSADLATGQISVIGRNGVHPVISWPEVAWIEPDLMTSIEGQVLSRLAVLDLQSGTTSHLNGLRGLTELGIHGDTVVSTDWTLGGVASAIDLAQTRRRVITPHEGNPPTRLTLNDRIVAWTSSGLPRVWDRKLERLVNVGGYVNGMEARLVNGQTLAWQSVPNFEDWMAQQSSGTLPGNMTIYVLDTSQLAE